MAIVLCDHCAQAIKSRGESLEEVADLDEALDMIVIDEDGNAECEWCREVLDATDLKAYK